jgi:hypothetical protein
MQCVQCVQCDKMNANPKSCFDFKQKNTFKIVNCDWMA